MNLAELRRAEPTIDENISRGLIAWILRQPWQYYHTELHRDVLDVEDLADRFLRLHALVPGAVSPTTRGVRPIAILRCANTVGSNIIGAQYLNGAVLVSDDWTSGSVCLMVESDTAQMWGYPDTNYKISESLPEEEQD